MPFAGDERAFALVAFDLEAAFLVAADCADVVVEDPQVNPVEANVIERVPEDEAGCFFAQTTPPQRAVVDADGVSGTAVRQVEGVKESDANEPALELHRPTGIASAETLESGCAPRQG